MKDENKSKASIILDAICGILMLISILTYVIIGLVAQVWHPTWIIIVAAGFACGVMGIINDAVTKIKSQNKSDE